MQAVILEIKDGIAAVLSDDGRIVKVKNYNYEIGQVIQMSTPKKIFSRKVAAFIASTAAIFMVSTGIWAYASPYSYVSFDVNPSIEFTVNRFDRVININAVNDDGKEIVKEISLDNLENKAIVVAIKETVKQVSEEGYFDGDTTGGIVITTSGQNAAKADELAQHLQTVAKTEVADNGDDVEVVASHVDLNRVKEAHKLGVTPGKLNLVEKLKASASDPSSIDIQDWLGKPVKDIIKATKENRELSITSGSTNTPKKETSNKTIGSLTENPVKADKNVKHQVKDKNINKNINRKDKKSVKSDTKTKSKIKNIKTKIKKANKIRPKKANKIRPKKANKIKSKKTNRIRPKKANRIKTKKVNKIHSKKANKIKSKNENNKKNKINTHKKYEANHTSKKDSVIKNEVTKSAAPIITQKSNNNSKKVSEKRPKNNTKIAPSVKPVGDSNQQTKDNQGASKPGNNAKNGSNNTNINSQNRNNSSEQSRESSETNRGNSSNPSKGK